MELKDVLQKRYSVRSYQDRPVEDDKLAAVLEAARIAPSGNNGQSWAFVVVREAERRAKMQAACNNQKFIAQAPVIIAAVGLTPERIMSCEVPADPVNVAIAIDHMTLAATDLGLGTCWIGAFNQQAVRELLGIPDEARVIECLTLGYPADEPRAKNRKALDEIVHWERW